MHYRFETGTFIKADTFEEAKKKYIEKIKEEVEDEDSWCECTCLGLSHRYDCPVSPIMKGEIPF